MKQKLIAFILRKFKKPQGLAIHSEIYNIIQFTGATNAGLKNTYRYPTPKELAHIRTESLVNYFTVRKVARIIIYRIKLKAYNYVLSAKGKA